MTTILTPEAVAERIGVTPMTLAKWRSAGIGPAYAKLAPKTVRYRESDVEAWLNSKILGSGAPESTRAS